MVHAVRRRQEPSRDEIDTKGIDAKGGPDTVGIYGFAREIVEKEEAQTPFRRLRLIAYSVPAFVSCVWCLFAELRRNNRPGRVFSDTTARCVTATLNIRRI